MFEDAAKGAADVSRNRMIAGTSIFVAGQLAPLAIFGVANSPLPDAWKTTISGLLFFGVPQLSTLLAIVVLGRAGFNALRSRLFGWAKGMLFPETVSPLRYHAGLVLFLIPLLYGWVSPYFYEVLPELARLRLALAIAGDVSLVVGVLMMGGQFWDKLRALFVHDAEVTFPSAA